MPFDPTQRLEACPLCNSAANGLNVGFQWRVVDCSLCGDFRLSNDAADEVTLPFQEPKKLGLVRHLLFSLQKQHQRPTLDANFFKALDERSLPTPAVACDNLIKWFAGRLDRRLGANIFCDYASKKLSAEIGLVDNNDLRWIVISLQQRNLLQGAPANTGFYGNLTVTGWERFEELQRAHISSNYAFFARKFKNDALDELVESCLRPAVEQTGFELRTVTQKAGLIDAIIEDEIRRCKFLLADLSDDNAGAYWEAGFAEGLGKPVIYICREKTEDEEEIKTHFDTDHRHTVRWDLSSLDFTTKQLKAVIRNTLLGDAKQDD